MDKKIANTKQPHILWVDLEMTGLDPEKDRILEVGAIITDWDFKEVASYEAAVKVPDAIVKDRMFNGPAATFWESVPATRDALIQQNQESAQPKHTVEDALLVLVDQYFKADIPVLLAGNSIHMDRRFIEKEFTRLTKRLHYRMLDVSAWKVVFEAKYRKKYAKREAHRALDDIRGSIEELQYYTALIKK